MVALIMISMYLVFCFFCFTIFNVYISTRGYADLLKLKYLFNLVKCKIRSPVKHPGLTLVLCMFLLSILSMTALVFGVISKYFCKYIHGNSMNFLDTQNNHGMGLFENLIVALATIKH